MLEYSFSLELVGLSFFFACSGHFYLDGVGSQLLP